MKISGRVKWWQILLAAVVVSAIGALTTRRPNNQQRELYEKELEQAPWAPPGWLFGPAWTFNNIFLLMALSRLLRTDHPHRNSLLYMQAAIWVIYFSFGYVYFHKRSPVLAAVWTIADATLAVSSMSLAARADRRLAANYIPLTVWTGFAGSVAVYQALHNPDPLLG